MGSVRVGVTGTDSPVGRAVAAACADRGDEVRGVTDVRDGWHLSRAFRGCEVVVHAAELSADARATERVFMRDNAEAADLVLRMARRAGARRVVLLSSAAVYGVPDRWPISEDAPQRPWSAYGRSKLAAEHHAWRQVDDGYDVVVLRVRPVIGPSVPGALGRFLFPPLARRGRWSARLPLVLPSRGRNRCQITPVADLVGAIGSLIDQGGRLEWPVLNIGADTPRALVDDLRRLLAAVSGGKPLLSLPEGPGTAALGGLFRVGLAPWTPETLHLFDTDVVMGTQRARECLGYRPTVEPVDTLIESYAWWRGSDPG